MTKIDAIIEQLRMAPPSLIDEVSALMEARLRHPSPTNSKHSHGIMRHYGRLKDSKVFAGDPVAIQQALRDECD